MRTKRLCAEFASRLARYTQDNLPRLQELITEVEEANENEVETDIIPAEIDNRTEDKLTPLFVMAYAAGPAWWKRMENAWRMMNPAKTREELRPGVQLLLDLRDLFARDGRARWSTAELIYGAHPGRGRHGRHHLGRNAGASRGSPRWQGSYADAARVPAAEVRHQEAACA